MKKLCPLLLALAGCGGCYSFDGAPGWNLPGPDVYFRWHESVRDVPMVMSESLTPECQAAVYAGLEWWREQGIDFVEDPSIVPQSRAHATREGEIAVSAGTPDKESHVGATSQLAKNYFMHSAQVRFLQSWCNPTLAAHELGHALGLPDIYDTKEKGNVMFWTLPGAGLHVTKYQLEKIK